MLAPRVPPTPARGAARSATTPTALALLATLLIVLSARAQETGVGAEPDTSFLAGEEPGPTLALTLDQALRLAAAHSPAARGAAADLRGAEGARMTAASAFDPVLVLSGEQADVESPVTSPFSGSKLITRATEGGLEWLAPIGTRVHVGFGRTRIETNAPFSTLPTERRARARIDFVQPLLQGVGPAATRGGLRAARRAHEAAREALAQATLDLEAEVGNAYWALYAAERRLHVQGLLRQSAAVFLRDQVLRGRAGVVGPGAVATARTFLAEQETALLDARLQTAVSADRLAEVIGLRPGGGESYRTLGLPPMPEPVAPLEALMSLALDANPALRAARADSAAARARERQAAWRAWPTLEAFGGYGASGLSGVGRQIVFGSDTVGTVFDRGFGDAWDQVSGRDYPEWSFGLRLRMPIGWRGERGEHRRLQGQYERAREALRARRLALESAVRAAHRESALGPRELEAALTLVTAAEEQARIARLEYQAGRGTAYDLVNFEADLARARLREAEVRVRIVRAANELRRLTTPAPGRPSR